MRSSPLLLLVLVLLGFGGLAVPLTRLTAERPAVAIDRSLPAAGTVVDTHVRLRFAHQPVGISLRQGGRVVAEVDRPGENPLEVGIPLDFSGSAVELEFEVRWPAGTPATALTIELEPDGMDARAVTEWTDTAVVAGVALFSWQ